VVGVIADAAAVVLLFWAPWSPVFTKGGWDLAVGTITIVSIAAGLLIYFVSERTRGQLRPAVAGAETA
jgi:hypothetical protein